MTAVAAAERQRSKAIAEHKRQSAATSRYAVVGAFFFCSACIKVFRFAFVSLFSVFNAFFLLSPLFLFIFSCRVYLLTSGTATAPLVTLDFRCP